MTSPKSMICLCAAFFVIFMGFSRPSWGKCYKPFESEAKECVKVFRQAVKNIDKGVSKITQVEIKPTKGKKKKEKKGRREGVDLSKIAEQLESKVKERNKAEMVVMMCIIKSSKKLEDCYKKKYKANKYVCDIDEFRKLRHKYQKATKKVVGQNDECDEECHDDFNKKGKIEIDKGKKGDWVKVEEEFDKCRDECNKKFPVRGALKGKWKNLMKDCMKKKK